MRLILVTPDVLIHNELEIINALFANGLQRLHVRKAGFHADDYRGYIAQIEPQYHNRIVIGICFELYEELGLGGVHLNSALRDDWRIWGRIKHIPAQAVSTSFHSWDEVLAADFNYGYVFISPVFDSISKPGYMAGIDLQQCEAVRQQVITARDYCPQIIGLGGVGAQQVSELDAKGFDGAALLGSVWNAEDTVAAFIDCLTEVAKLND